MKPAVAKVIDNQALADLGRATLHIVHDLKNQLNGLKLYATFLRKRLETEDQSSEERETLAKLIAGLDRAAKDLTALVRYAQPLELRRQPHTDLLKIIDSATREAASQLVTNSMPVRLVSDTADESLYGAFDPAALAEAIRAITERAADQASRAVSHPTVHVSKAGTPASPEALIEWRDLKLGADSDPFRSFHGKLAARLALAAKIIEAHFGRVECDATTIRVSLPLTI